MGAVLAFIPKRLLFAVLAAAAGAAAIWGVYLYGKHEGRQAAAVDAAQATAKAIQKRSNVDEKIIGLDAHQLCVELGGGVQCDDLK